MMLVGGSPTPPTPQNLIPYIRNNDSNAYIDTGITPDNNTHIIVWARNFNPQSIALFGSQTAANGTGVMLSSYTRYNTGGLRLDYNDTYVTTLNQFARLSGYHKYEIDQGVLKVDDETVSSITDAEFSNNYPIHLFGCNRGGAHVGTALSMDICACKIYKNNVLVRDYTPVKSPSVGFYDSVSGTVFTNAGNGSLSYGEFNANAYSPLEYIVCTGTQWFDSGINGKNGTILSAYFMPLSTSDTSHALFGTMVSGSGSDYLLAQFGSANYPNSRLTAYFGSTTGQLLRSNTTNRMTDKDIVFSLGRDGNCQLARNGSTYGTAYDFTISAGIETTRTVKVAALDNNGNVVHPFQGRLYYFGIGTISNYRSLVPAKKNGVVGMYDTFNDVFYSSESGTPFVEPTNS